MKDQSLLPLITVSEAQKFLRISRTTIWAEVASGRLPTVRIGRRRLVRQSDLQAYIDQRLEAGPLRVAR